MKPAHASDFLLRSGSDATARVSDGTDWDGGRGSCRGRGQEAEGPVAVYLFRLARHRQGALGR